MKMAIAGPKQFKVCDSLAEAMAFKDATHMKYDHQTMTSGIVEDIREVDGKVLVIYSYTQFVYCV